MKLKIKKVHPDAVTPTYATSGSACFDLTAAAFDAATGAWRTGLTFEIPEGHVMRIYSRSGHGFKHGVRLSNCVGIIDSDYRGEVMVKLHQDSVANGYLTVSIGDRIAQAEVGPVQQVEFEEVDELSSTDRGVGGFGSSGS